MRYGRQPLRDIDEWTIDELYEWHAAFGRIVKQEGIPDGG